MCSMLIPLVLGILSPRVAQGFLNERDATGQLT